MPKYTKADPYLADGDAGAISEGWARGMKMNQDMESGGERADFDYEGSRSVPHGKGLNQPVKSGTAERVQAPFKENRV